MSPPSYARATASSASKRSPKAAKATKDAEPVHSTPRFLPKTPERTPRKSTKPAEPKNATPTTQETKNKKTLKRPSLLTPHQKDSMTYKRDLYHITPKDASKPCPLATLPSELRTLIYTYVLPATHSISDSWARITKYKQHVAPALLHTSRAIRIEAAYTCYTRTRFQFSVRNLDFGAALRWLEQLPAAHRALLARNPGLQVNVLPTVKSTYTYPPKGWLLDNYLEQHWRACQPYGNIYTVASGDAHKLHFLLFCRLAEWWRWRARPPNRDIKVEYAFQQSPYANPWGIPDSFEEEAVRILLSEHGLVVGMPCVDRAWERNRSVARLIKSEARAFFEALDHWYYARKGRDERDEAWDGWMKEANKALDKW